ncbi:MAG TPA: hypothetical protein VGP52_02295 [Stellaceae bacterium]|nr:hypothetical protein [Stellaceae bacterium]
MIRTACWLWAAVIMLIMWSPEPNFGGFDLGSPVVQGVTFALGAVLFALADRSRPHFFRRAGGSQSPIAYLVLRFKGHLLRIAALLALYAVLLEIGQFFVIGRAFRFGQLADNLVSILLAGVALYIGARLLLANRYLNHITRRHLARMAAALRAEAKYSADLRDAVQAGYALCVAPTPSPAEKIEGMRRLLDDALGAELPNPAEDLLDTALGARMAVPAPYRPSAELAVPPVSDPPSP